MKTNLPHLVVTGYELNRFTKGSSPPIPPPPQPQRIRVEHGALLKQRLARAWDAALNESVVYHSSRKGVYLEFKGEPGYELVTRSLERLNGKNPEKKVRLLNIRSEVEGEGDGPETTYATVFVPHKQKDFFFNRIEQYAKEEGISGKPKHAKLIESISDIRKALDVESFWQDQRNLIPSDKPAWCEVWLSSERDDVIHSFENLLSKLDISQKSGVIRFPERAVKVIHASRAQLETITHLSDNIAEYRRAKETAAFWLDQTNSDQADWTTSILERLEVDKESNVAVCILDTGVNNGHPLISPLLDSQHCQSVYPEWGTHDHNKHGTLMAGVSAYGNLQEILSNDALIRLEHCLESVKILPPTEANEPGLWGYVSAQGVYRAEIQSPNKKRITCMAVTSDDTRDRGRPSSWSAEVDQVCSGAEDDMRRLFILSAGNSSLTDRANYPHAQETDSVHDPAQSWNALTVGSYTQLDHIRETTLSGYEALAPFNGLSPFSTTSTSWNDMWPIKPEVVMEGGNLARESSTGFVTECDDLSMLSTFYAPQQSHFYPFNMTSAATAQAAWFAAQIQAAYSNFWPESIRGLMVHSAEWTDILKQQFLKDENKGSYKKLLRVCGYGVPNLKKALYSAGNSLTLIAQSELQPFDKKDTGSGYRTHEMHFYTLPWPREVLQSLSDSVEVKMRITLSYFIEPGPGEIGWKDRYRYASHGLRFDLNSPAESKDQFLRRINAEARDEENGKPGTPSASNHWVLGAQVRNKGSIHSDIWKGSAAELAASNLIAIYPTIGWWKERAHLMKWNRKTRYSLIVSIETPEQSVDIYTPVAVQIGVAVPVEIGI